MGADSRVGIFNGKKVFSSKYITAMITDGSSKLHFIPIQYTIGDFFITTINKLIYVFKVDGTRIHTSNVGGAKSFKVLLYDTSHYLPISPPDIKEMELILSKNNLPKVDNKLFNILKSLSKTEKEQVDNLGRPIFEPHNLIKVIEKLSTHQDRYNPEIEEMVDFMVELEIDKIVTPLKRLVDFIQGDLKTADSRVLGDMFLQANKMNEKGQKIINPTLTAKKSWLVMILALGMVIMVVALLYVANDAGYFDNVGSMVPGISSIGSGAGYSEKELQAKYPSGPALKAAVESGKLDYNKLPKAVQDIVDKTPSPVPQPAPTPDTGQ